MKSKITTLKKIHDLKIITFKQHRVSQRVGREHPSQRRGSTRSRQGDKKKTFHLIRFSDQIDDHKSEHLTGCSSTSFDCREAVVRFETKEEEQIHPPAPALVKEVEPVVTKNEVKNEAKEAVVLVEEEVKEEVEEEKRKKEGRRRRKKHGSEDPEEGAGGHRVVICDDQVVSNFILTSLSTVLTFLRNGSVLYLCSSNLS